jgi:hypothetical protein
MADVAENEVARGPNDARLHDKFGYKLKVPLGLERLGVPFHRSNQDAPVEFRSPSQTKRSRSASTK